jgi:hypothetical protein
MSSVEPCHPLLKRQEVVIERHKLRMPFLTDQGSKKREEIRQVYIVRNYQVDVSLSEAFSGFLPGRFLLAFCLFR